MVSKLACGLGEFDRMSAVFSSSAPGTCFPLAGCAESGGLRGARVEWVGVASLEGKPAEGGAVVVVSSVLLRAKETRVVLFILKASLLFKSALDLSTDSGNTVIPTALVTHLLSKLFLLLVHFQHCGCLLS